jgi:hypothetical protein
VYQRLISLRAFLVTLGSINYITSVCQIECNIVCGDDASLDERREKKRNVKIA